MKELRIGTLTAPIPIIQGGMGFGISRSSLAGAVAAEGGVGIIFSARACGIYGHADIEHALSLGTDGVQIASRFVATYECDASAAYKQAYECA